jgi:natural product biosynthesis luciferase-like monooxygenase protein
MSYLEKKLATLSPAKRALFESLVKQKALTGAGEPPGVGGVRKRSGAFASDAREEACESGASDDGMKFSLFFFSEDGSESKQGKYELLIESVRFADEHGFSAVWTPERHFHAFGGPYPNPSLIAAALAMITKNVELRAGSVVLPLHDSIRVAEEWAVVDNLSNGRAAVSFATGWHLDDFVLAPDKYAARKEITLREIETVKRLWEGEPVVRVGAGGREVEIKSYPRPLRKPLPIWLTAATSPETFVMAGEIGVDLLTGLTGQQVGDLAAKIGLYREARARCGHDPAAGVVALMLHTYIGDCLSDVREKVRLPMYDYLRTNLNLHKNLATRRDIKVGDRSFSSDDEETLLSFAFERYFNGSSLFGTVETARLTVERLKAIGVDEVACLIDFGLDNETVVEGLRHLNELRCRVARSAARPQSFAV